MPRTFCPPCSAAIGGAAVNSWRRSASVRNVERDSVEQVRPSSPPLSPPSNYIQARSPTDAFLGRCPSRAFVVDESFSTQNNPDIVHNRRGSRANGVALEKQRGKPSLFVRRDRSAHRLTVRTAQQHCLCCVARLVRRSPVDLVRARRTELTADNSVPDGIARDPPGDTQWQADTDPS